MVKRFPPFVITLNKLIRLGDFFYIIRSLIGNAFLHYVGEIAGSNPVLTTKGANPETWKEKVGDSSERRHSFYWRCKYAWVKGVALQGDDGKAQR